ncbi:HipA N-terminal domain-containing protein [Rhizobium sullae]|uniref:HipA N-terminal domain-containing protein n=1 Tax=Rhizobium sullae TaxID=50338 RepID=UPI000B35D8F5|nr:HipA N-terminal domain-containing protein [Rhizobium sullae]
MILADNSIWIDHFRHVDAELRRVIEDDSLDGYPDPIGALIRDARNGLAFAYNTDYVASRDAIPFSLSLPLNTEPYDDLVARPFFDSLLQERDGALTEVMAREHLARDDVAGLLFHMGKDCAGALSVLPLGAPPAKVPGDYDKDYQPIPDDRLTAIVDALHKRKRLWELRTI